ncbi:TIGR01741 family protein, partial [Staphylococcus aureus]|uniref:TIGR01741 family protein n=1 Tax=Staphylococcus aureus TaxID=1280 RepID=UPI0012B26D63
MTFEEKLSQKYNEIANKISSMIPVEWEKVYAMAYIDDGGGEVFYYYTEPGSNELYYYTSVLNKYDISESEFMDSVYVDLCQEYGHSKKRILPRFACLPRNSY